MPAARAGNGGGESAQAPQRRLSARRPGKWFALDIEDSDIFRDEIRLWRNISSFVPTSVRDSAARKEAAAGAAEGDSSAEAHNAVPTLILDVILDTSALSPQHILMIDESAYDDSDASPKPPHRRRVRSVGTGKVSTSDAESESSSPSSIPPVVLETWRLDLDLHDVADPPDLPTLYKHATAHFRELVSAVTRLPAYQLFSRIKGGLANAATAAEQRGSRQATRESTGRVIASSPDRLDLIKIGARLAVDHSSPAEDGLIGLRQPVASASPKHGAEGKTDIKPESRTFGPIITPIGTLVTSVEYRANANFYVEDTKVVQGLQEAALDDDYFTTTGARSRPSHSKYSSSGETQHARVSQSDRPHSLLSATSHRRQIPPLGDPASSSGIAASHGSVSGNSASTPTEGIARASVPSATATATMPTSVTATASGRPVAGLSSLRSSPSVAGYSAAPSGAVTAAGLGPLGGTLAPSSPALPGALTSEAAFLAHGRKQSVSERRMRTLSTQSGSGSPTSTDKDSPPSPIVTASPLASRPILTRTAASAFPRTGSYSPSSPSPLAQQLYAQQAATGGYGGSRLSSSPSFRLPTFAPPSSMSPSLRSVFQAGTPSASQTSVSSFSRTPPKAYVDAVHGASKTLSGSGSSSSAGLRSGAAGEDTSAGSSRQQRYDSAQGGSLGSSSARQPSVAPQMIKRYSSTFSYRHGRQGTSVESDASEGSGSANAPYSRSWQARIEQRQMFAARSLGRDESYSGGRVAAGGVALSSPRSHQQQHPLPSGVPRSHDEGLDDLVRLLDSKPSLSLTGTRSGSGSSSVEGADLSSRPSDEHRFGSRPPMASSNYSVQQSASGIGPSWKNSNSSSMPFAMSSAGFPRHHALDRSQVDEMLSRMQRSVRNFTSPSVASRGSPASGEAGTSSGGQSQPDYPTAPQGLSPVITRSPLGQGAVISASSTRRDTSPSGNKSNLLQEARYDNEEAHHALMTGSSHEGIQASVPPSRGSLRYEMPKNPRPQGLRDVSASSASRPLQYRSSRAGTQAYELDVDEDDDIHEDEPESPHEVRLSRSHPGRETSRGSLELYGPVGSHTYDPLDDETAGRMELAGDDVMSDGGGVTSAAAGRSGTARLGGMRSTGAADGRSGSRDRDTPRRHLSQHAQVARPVAGSGAMSMGARFGGPTSHAVCALSDNEEDRQRDADRELARYFGQTVGASSMRGGAAPAAGRPPFSANQLLPHQPYSHARASMSPWRQRGFHPTSLPVGSPGTGSDKGSNGGSNGFGSSPGFASGPASGGYGVGGRTTGTASRPSSGHTSSGPSPGPIID